MQGELLDVLVIGAGVSGIAMGCALLQRCPGKRFAILDGRARPGGTWDLFRYPGARSDSDLYSYAYSHRPWLSPRVLGSAEEIRRYLADTAAEAGLDRHMHFGVRVRSATWSSVQRCWTVHTEHLDGWPAATWRARFLVLGTGYYDHDAGHAPTWPGQDGFAGQVVHPQHWPEGLSAAGRRVVVIGSGATAVSLAPRLAEDGARVTLLQRSPVYLAAMPSQDPLAPRLARVLPERVAYAAARRFHIGLASLVYRSCRRWPRLTRALLLRHVREALGPAIDRRHVEPRHAPWDQRLCAVADGDLFRCVREGRVQLVTDEIERFDAGGLVLRSGARIDADLVVTATGLRLQAVGGIDLQVDGQRWVAGEHLLYRGVLPEGLPNAAWILGYVNASWTLKAELAATYVCRLLQHLDQHGLEVAMARDEDGCHTDANILSDLRAGYVERLGSVMPRQGSRAPWRVTHRLEDDRRQLLRDPVDDGVLAFEARRSGAGWPRDRADGARPADLHTFLAP